MNDIALNGIERIVIDEVKAFFSNPENERKFQEWKKNREAQKEGGKLHECNKKINRK